MKYWAIYWKIDHPLFSDPRVRRGLTLAIDRRELLRVRNVPTELLVTDGVITRRQLWRRELPEPLPYDPAGAHALLDAAGWLHRNSDGVRERDGRPFRFTAIVRNSDGLDRLAVHVQAYLRRLGVQMDIQVLDPSLVRQRVDIGRFEAALMHHNTAVQKQYLGRGNPAGYTNPEAFRLIDDAAEAADPDEEDRLQRELTAVYRADLPVTCLIPITVTHFAHRRVQGLTTPFRADPDRCMEDLWIEE